MSYGLCPNSNGIRGYGQVQIRKFKIEADTWNAYKTCANGIGHITTCVDDHGSYIENCRWIRCRCRVMTQQKLLQQIESGCLNSPRWKTSHSTFQSKNDIVSWVLKSWSTCLNVPYASLNNVFYHEMLSWQTSHV